MDIEKLTKLYTLTEMKYIEKNKEIPEEKLFPIDWYSTTNYIEKMKILSEAIKNNVLIKDTLSFPKFNGVTRIRK